MERLDDRFTLWVLRSIATAMLFFGASVIMVGMPAAGMLTGSSVTRTIAAMVLGLGCLFVAAGAAAIYLSRSHGLVLPNERAAASSVRRPAIGGWLIALAATLVIIPVWLVIRLQPFLAEWDRVVDLLATWDIWRGADANGSGIVLLPLAAALTPPTIEFAAMVSLVVASVVLLVSLLSRSQRFPRIYLVCVVLSGALVIASVLGASAATLAGEAVAQLIEGTSASAEESTQLRDALQRYTGIVGFTAPVLVWSFCGYLIWMPGIVFSQRARRTFAVSDAHRLLTPAGTADCLIISISRAIAS